MPLSPQDIENIIQKALPGFSIVDQPQADDPELFAKPEASSPDFQKIQAKLGGTTHEQPPAPPAEVAADDVITVPVRSPDNPLQPSAGSQLKYVYISTKTREIVAVQG